jgi:hypothetical protein
VSRATRIRLVSEHDNEEKRADMVGASVTVLHGKAAEFAIKEFFAEAVPKVRGELVKQQRGLPPELEIL